MNKLPILKKLCLLLLLAMVSFFTMPNGGQTSVSSAYAMIRGGMTMPAGQATEGGGGGGEGGGAGIPVVNAIIGALGTVHGFVRRYYMAISSALTEAITGAVEAVDLAVIAGFEVLEYELNLAGGGVIGAINARSAGQTKIAQAKVDNHTENVFMAAAMKVAGKFAPIGVKIICKAAAINQAPLLVAPFAKGVSSMVQRTLLNAYRGKKSDGNGPKYAFNMEKTRCKYGFADAELDGYTEIDGEDCAKNASVRVGTAKLRLVDADIKPVAFDGNVPLKMPEMKETTDPDTGKVTLEPEAKKPEEKLWLAGFMYCLQMQGPRVTLPQVKNVTNNSARMAYNHALAIQSGFNKQCADLLGYFTRPSQKDTPKLFAALNKQCTVAKEFLNEDEVKNRFGDCKDGLSLYEAELMTHKLCKSAAYMHAKRGARRNERDLVEDGVKCAIEWNTWKTRVATMRGALVNAARGQLNIKRKWPTNTAGYMGGPQKRYVKNIQKPALKEKYHNIKSVPLNGPTYPKVVAQ